MLILCSPQSHSLAYPGYLIGPGIYIRSAIIPDNTDKTMIIYLNVHNFSCYWNAYKASTLPVVSLVTQNLLAKHI